MPRTTAANNWITLVSEIPWPRSSLSVGWWQQPGADDPVVPAEEEQRRESQPNMFRKNAEEEKRSKIFNALNPQSLAYVSAREKAEMEQESTQLQVRGGFGGFNRDGGMGPDFAKMRDDEGNIIDPSESEEEEEDVGYADGNVPDFGEFQGVLDEARQRRAKEEAEHKAKLREAWEKKKADEEAERQKLLKVRYLNRFV